jgi:hypothetical protein
MNASVRSIFSACSASTGRPFILPQRGNAKCPFHRDSTASLSVNESKGVWNCFGCGLRGGVLDVPIAFGIVDGRSESARWLADRGLIPPAQADGFGTIVAPNRLYTDAKALAVDVRVWRALALMDLEQIIGSIRVRAARDHIAELRWQRDQQEGDGMALLRCAAVYEASMVTRGDANIVQLARDTFPECFVNDPLSEVA